jgi:hypothetical protein
VILSKIEGSKGVLGWSRTGNNFIKEVYFNLGLIGFVRELLTFENLGTRVLTFS